MRKLASFLCVSVLAASLLTLSVSASDYGQAPVYTPPATTAVKDTVVDAKAVTDAIKSGGVVKIETEGSAQLSKDAISEIKNATAPVVFEAKGFTITIDPQKITNSAKAIDLSMTVTAAPAKTIAPGVPAPEKAIVIAPAASGDFGFEMTITIPAATVVASGVNTAKLKVYYISDNGDVSLVSDNVTVGSDGSVSISISHASQYVITDEDMALTDDDDELDGDWDDDTDDDADDDSSDDVATTNTELVSDTGKTETNPSTGVSLSIVSAIAFGAITVASSKAKKSK